MVTLLLFLLDQPNGPDRLTYIFIDSYYYYILLDLRGRWKASKAEALRDGKWNRTDVA
jgi:hypothetical protein